jgi:peroxiredoxin
MVTTLCLLSCVLATGQAGERPAVGPPADREPGGWVLTPRLSRGEEAVYRGSFSEEDASARGVQFSRFYRLECRAFVLDAPIRGLDVAFLTLLRGKAESAANGQEPAASVRLEVVQVDVHGRVTGAGGRPLAVPLEGPPTVECGAFVEAPATRVLPEQTWEVAEEGRPARTWRLAGTDPVNGTQCLKLVGLQQSDDWDRPRGDRAAWRRQDTVWLSPRLALAYRVERVIERRDAGRRDPDANHRSILRYELDSIVPQPGKLFDDRRDEITQARAFQERATALMARPGRDRAAGLDVLLGKINHHLEHQLPTPYREAVLQVKRRVEAAQRGETPPAPVAEETPAAPAVAVPGSAAPDFLATDLVKQQSVRLQQCLGRPVVLVFYRPTSFNVEDLLRFAQRLADNSQGRVAVLGLVMSEDVPRVRRQHDELRLTFPLLDGTGLSTSYAVDSTPKLMVLDAGGVVVGSYTGWGQETPGAVLRDLQRCSSPHNP